MTLTAGSRLDFYEILAPIGVGGMGEVYRARDSKLGREVAVKVLPDAFALDSERQARFQREAQVLASLNHPNIATIFGFEESEGKSFLVMELVPGETLAERIAQGPIPIDESLALFKQIAEALDAAHQSGVIHRDLKPANIKITPDEQVKILDFGLAKTLDVEPISSDPAQSPTVTFENTRPGLILGTPGYMSPEQARGKPVDKRADIWAFGCCLYEALTGAKTFEGETLTDVLAAIVNRDPEWETLPEATPASIRFLLRRCLEKDAKRRLRDLGDAWLEPDETLSELFALADSGSDTAQIPLWRRAIPWLLVAVVGALAVWSWNFTDSQPQLPERHLTISLPASEPLALAGLAPLGEGRPSLALSPDGTRLVYVASSLDVPKLFLRPMNKPEATPISGTEGAFNPFFSPNGRWVGFFADNQLKKVSLLGGDPVPLCEVNHPFGATWAPNGTIYFADTWGERLRSISVRGGQVEDIGKGRFGRYLWPEVLPNGKGLLVYQDGVGINIVLPESGEEQRVLNVGTHARYVSTGHLVYALPGRLMAVPFDIDRLQVTGPEVAVVDGVRTELRGAAQFSTASDGTLVYLAGGSAAIGRLVQRNPEVEGSEQRLEFDPDFYGTFTVSPDGGRLAIEVRGDTVNIRILDLERGGSGSELTSEGNNRYPIWASDGEEDWIVFTSDRDGASNLFRKRADGGGEAERLTRCDYDQSPYSVSHDGIWLAFSEDSPERYNDILVLRIGTQEKQPIVQTQHFESQGYFSPDGPWVAYTSFERTNRFQVFVQRFPAGGKQQVSSEGGEEPAWSPNGDKLYYRNGLNWMEVSIISGQELSLSQPQPLFRGEYLNVSGRSYDVKPDGDFILLKSVQDPAPTQLRVVLNWFQELKRRAPPRIN